MKEKNQSKTDTSSVNQEGNLPPNPFWLKILLIIITLLVLSILVIMVWGNYATLEQRVIGTYTSTPLPPTNTATITATPTITSTPTPLPTATNTPLPASAYQVTDLELIDPPIPGLEGPTIILDESSPRFLVEPAFDSGTWTSSVEISEQLGIQFADPYYATFAAAKVAWSVDVPLESGFYEIYVLDTLYSSAGLLDYYVLLGNNWISPRYGTNRVNFLTTTGNPAQISDMWRSIGIYSLDQYDYLTIYSEWENRDEFTVVAVDRVMIVRLPVSSAGIAEKLPPGELVQIVDDRMATIVSKEVFFTVSEQLAWGDSYHLIINPQEDLIARWKLQDPMPVGLYDVFVWIPRVNGEASATYQVFANGNPLVQESGNTSVTIPHGNRDSGMWVSLGRWEVPLYLGNTVQLSLEMNIPGNTTGEIAVDAAAFIKLPVAE